MVRIFAKFATVSLRIAAILWRIELPLCIENYLGIVLSDKQLGLRRSLLRTIVGRFDRPNGRWERPEYDASLLAQTGLVAYKVGSAISDSDECNADVSEYSALVTGKH